MARDTTPSRPMHAPSDDRRTDAELASILTCDHADPVQRQGFADLLTGLAGGSQAIAERAAYRRGRREREANDARRFSAFAAGRLVSQADFQAERDRALMAWVDGQFGR